MLLNKVELYNFKAFRGKHALDFSINPNSGRNIVLIGGLNGSGKTSILEAIKLALYGSLAKDLYGGLAYETYIFERINRDSIQDGSCESSVVVELLRKGIHDYSVIHFKRTWKLSELNNLVENFEIIEDGYPLDFNEDEYKDYISEIMPFAVSKFFFFDGEKIQEFADGDRFGNKLSEAIRDVLGINFYLNLIKDLLTYEKSKGYFDDVNISSEINSIRSVIKSLEKDLNHNLIILSNIDKEIASKHKELEIIRNWLNRYGINEKLSKTNLEIERKNIEQQRIEFLKKFKNAVRDNFPLKILLPLFNDLMIRIENEKNNRVMEGLLGNLSNIWQLFCSDLRGYITTFTEEQIIDLDKYGLLVWKKIIGKNVFKKNNILHLSENDEKIIFDKMKEIIEYDYYDLHRLNNDINILTIRSRKLRFTLERYPEDQTYIEQEKSYSTNLKLIENLNQKKGQVVAKLNELEKNIFKLKQREKDFESDLLLGRKIKEKVVLSKNIRMVLNEYLENIIKQRANEVSLYLTEMFQSVSHKKLVSTLRIYPDTFNITLLDNKNKILLKDNLSAGEKEVFSISLIWALSKVSKKVFPVVIDTPLGRLDSIHRLRIVEQYLPKANHQVIVLSSDTEIDNNLYESIYPYISKVYTLKNNSGEVKINEGYFGGNKWAIV